MADALDIYLAEVERGLGGLSRGKRCLYLRELRTHLMDEAECRGLKSENDLRALMAEKEPPAQLAEHIVQGEEGCALHRGQSAILAGTLIGLAAGLAKAVLGLPWDLCLGWSVALGLAVAASLIALRRHWQHYPPIIRFLAAILIGTLLAIPLGFTGRDFWAWRLFYGAFVGYLLERHSHPRPIWQLLLDTLGFTILTLVTDLYFFCPEKHFDWIVLGRLLCLNHTIALALMGATSLNRRISERRLLASQRILP